MIIDLEETDRPPLDDNYDVCIAGAGVAGIVLANRLAEGKRRVLVLEAGGLEYTEESQDVYIGDIVGQDYFNLDASRLRFLGGTSNHWGGLCRPLDSYDFGDRQAFAEAAWPIRRSDLDPYLDQTRAILELDEFPKDEIVPGSQDHLKRIDFLRSDVRFRDKYLDALKSSDTITVLINANVIDIKLDTERGDVASFVFRSYGKEQPFEARARSYVLALGGIENPRALLNANRQRPNGLGNEHDLVGRYFMEHPHFDIGYFVHDGSNELGDGRLFWAPTDEFMQAEAIANCGVRTVPTKGDKGKTLARAKASLRSIICASETAADLTRLFKPSFSCRKKERGSLPKLEFENAGYLQVASEQAPNRDSRVLLAEETDQFGLRRIALDWQLLPIDKKTIRACGLAMGEYFAREDIGRVKLHDWVLSEDAEFPGFGGGHEVGGHHHIGTTRMGSSAADGVVDGDGRVFGIDNLYIAGSSVFRTSGHANPTFTIVQLALRLGDKFLAMN